MRCPRACYDNVSCFGRQAYRPRDLCLGDMRLAMPNKPVNKMGESAPGCRLRGSIQFEIAVKVALRQS